MSVSQLEKSWAQRLLKAEEEITKIRQTDTCEGGFQTSCLESAGQSVSLEELEIRLNAQRETLQQEAVAVQAKAVEEAVRNAQRELQQKHTDALSLQVSPACC